MWNNPSFMISLPRIYTFCVAVWNEIYSHRIKSGNFRCVQCTKCSRWEFSWIVYGFYLWIILKRIKFMSSSGICNKLFMDILLMMKLHEYDCSWITCIIKNIFITIIHRQFIFIKKTHDFKMSIDKFIEYSWTFFMNNFWI